jgi:asparagine synthase (glutamine-hydrolysing)
MCGIALVVDRAGDGVDAGRLARMTAALAARGPDDEAYLLGDWATGGVERRGGPATDPAAPLPPIAEAGEARRWSLGLGVRRLAIRDPDPRARQPMRSPRGLWLAFNGELYDADEVRETLRGAGFAFATTGDTEVFLAAWEAWGPEALTRLSGMWAFVVWDAPHRRLWCGRDRLGIKPLYVARTAGAILVASTPGAIVAGLAGRPGAHAPAIAEYLATGLLDHAAPTCVAGIERIGAGCLLDVGASGASERRWAPPLIAPPSADRDPVRRFHAALDRAIATHRASDRPVGATLSGGLDSGTIVLSAAAGFKAADGAAAGAAATEAAAPLTLFTAGFGDAAYDECDAAASIAARTPFAWQVTDVGAPSGTTLADDVSTFLAGLDEPVVSSSVYAQWCVMRSVGAAGVRVVLDGQGADELLCGYPALVGPALADDVLGGDPGRAWAALGARAGKGEGSRAALAARGAVALLPEPLALAAGRLAAAGIGALHPELAATWHAAAPSMPGGVAATTGTRLSAARARLLAVHLPALLRYLDASAMAWSVEARVPFLDRDVLAAGVALGGDDLWRDGWQKWVLRDPAHSRLPDPVRLMPRKRAFAAPDATWWRGPLQAWLRDVLAPATIARQGLLAPAAVARALETLDAGGPAAPELWRWANVTWWID